MCLEIRDYLYTCTYALFMYIVYTHIYISACNKQIQKLVLCFLRCWILIMDLTNEIVSILQNGVDQWLLKSTYGDSNERLRIFFPFNFSNNQSITEQKIGHWHIFPSVFSFTLITCNRELFHSTYFRKTLTRIINIGKRGKKYRWQGTWDCKKRFDGKPIPNSHLPLT